jgi:hypothetical protein
MLGQNVTDGATDILVAAGHRKDNDGGGGGGARCSTECMHLYHLLVIYLYISMHGW